MLLYKIKYHYQTGDSFEIHDETRELEIVWKNLDNAKNALKRIQEHYKWFEYENRSSIYLNPPKALEPDWHKGEKFDFTIKLVLDNGKEVTFSAPWCGYFERLHFAEIISDDPDLRIQF